MLAHLLHLEGIESTILETRSREYVEHRVRAGVLEQGTADLMIETGLGERLLREGLVHHGIEIRFDGRGHRIALSDLTGGRSITIYGQQEVVKDLIRAREATGRPVLFEVSDVSLAGIDSTGPLVRYRHAGADHELRPDVIAGCDGFHGVSRGAVAPGILREYHHEYPFAWLGILAAVAPSTDELIYANHERGFALHSLRSPEVSRLYIQVDPTEEVERWPDERVWEELRIRLAAGDWTLADGPVLEKSIAPMRSFVVEPMQHGRLFLAGDAAHIVPATGAKGLNLAVADVRVLSRALAVWYATGDGDALDRYTSHCLDRVWRAQDFSATMSAMLHVYPGSDDFARRRQRAQLEYVCSSEAAGRSLAENYVGLPFS
jgi:p-hydroxybenzoate 3-monooxygenase